MPDSSQQQFIITSHGIYAAIRNSRNIYHTSYTNFLAPITYNTVNHSFFAHGDILIDGSALTEEETENLKSLLTAIHYIVFDDLLA